MKQPEVPAVIESNSANLPQFNVCPMLVAPVDATSALAIERPRAPRHVGARERSCAITPPSLRAAAKAASVAGMTARARRESDASIVVVGVEFLFTTARRLT